MKIYIIITAIVCCLLILFPLVFEGIYNGDTENENAVTSEVTATEDNILF